MKKIICIILTAIFLLTGTVALAATTPNAVLDARSSVVMIEVPTGDVVSMGTGFAVGTTEDAEYIVTNHHVIDGNQGVITVYSDNYSPTNASVLIDKPSADLCVLKLDSPIHGMKPFTLYTGDPYGLMGEKIYTLGFPGSADVLFARGASTTDDVSVADGIVSAVKQVNSDTLGVSALALQVNAAINHGNSGGPLVNENAVVLGINTYSANSFEDSSGVNGAISVSELISELDKNGIPYKSSSNLLFSGALWIILVAAAVAIVFLLWFFVLRKKFKRVKTISLSEYLEKSGGNLEYDRALFLIAPTAAQLAMLHRQGRAHLTVYPQNLRIQVAAGKAVLHAGKAELINGYSAPEQYKELAQTGTYTDVYQLGAVLYRLLVGGHLPDVMSRIENDAPAQTRIDALHIHSGAKQALKLAIAMNPDVRITNADQFISAFHITPEMTVLPAGLAKNERKKLNPKKKKRIIVLGIIGVAVAALCVCAGLFFTTLNQTTELLNNGDYKKAVQVAAKLPDLGDVPKLKRVASAGAALNEGDFDQVRELLSGIESDSYAQLILSDIDLMQGIHLIATGKPEEGEAQINHYRKNTPDADENRINYLRGEAYFAAQDYATAEKIYGDLGDYEDAHENASLCAIAMAAKKAEEGDIIGVVNLLRPYSDIPAVQALLENAQESLYVEAIDLLNEGNYGGARACFSAIPDYKDTDDYYPILAAAHYEDLRGYIGTELAQAVVYDSVFMIFEYLDGRWTNGNYYFEMDSEQNTSYNLPSLYDLGEYYEITTEGVLEGSNHKFFQFKIIDETTMDVYAFSNGNTYRMYRQ